ncbi:hypothetical protein AB0K92_22110 [Streptomyces sp. NPDC052687]|uniref:hypothetical protein n=1 Tax=Streptomyces sp. NPDC052687 TaxID=3154759 RepID=UPI0034399324
MCHEPTNVAADGHACPPRFRGLGPAVEPAAAVHHELRRGDVHGRQGDVDQVAPEAPIATATAPTYSRRELDVDATPEVRTALVFHHARNWASDRAFCMGPAPLAGGNPVQPARAPSETTGKNFRWPSSSKR